MGSGEGAKYAVTMADLMPAELVDLGGPWHLTSAARRSEALREFAPTHRHLTEALEVLEHCGRYAVDHAPWLAPEDIARGSELLGQDFDIWAWWPTFEAAMPTFDDVRYASVASLAERLQRSPEVVLELARIWVTDLAARVTEGASAWLAEHLAQSDDPTLIRRFLELAAALVPYLPGLVAVDVLLRLEQVGGSEALPYLLRIERAPATAPLARHQARELRERLEREAVPGGTAWPVELWRVRGRNLVRVRHGFVTGADRPPRDQLLELAFEDGSGLQFWAGRENTLHIKEEPYDADGLGDDWHVVDDTRKDPVCDAIGAELDDVVPLENDDSTLNGLSLHFGKVSVTLRVVEDLVLHISWGVAIQR